MSKSDRSIPSKQASNPSDLDRNRRRLSKAGLAAPLILSVLGRPAWGGACSMSGMLSGNLSDAAGEDIVCAGEGCSSTFWRNNTTLWHHQYLPDTLFNSVFNNTIYGSQAHGDQASLWDVIRKQVFFTNDSGCSKCAKEFRKVGQQAVSSLLNASTDVKYDLTVEEVILSFDLAYQAYANRDKQGIKNVRESLQDLNDNQTCPLF